MKRGPKFKPELLRYDEAGYGPCVYLVEVADMVKVGCTRMPAARLRNLHLQHEKQGQALGRFRVFPVKRPAFTDQWHAERYGIKALSGVFEVVPGRREYFTGCDLDSAALVLHGVFAARPT